VAFAYFFIYLKLINKTLNTQHRFADTKEKPKSDIVIFNNSKEIDVNSTFGEFYSIEICPKCHRLLDEIKARYGTKCCYKCGHTNGDLFYCQTAIVRDRFVDGKFIETVVVKMSNDE